MHVVEQDILFYLWQLGLCISFIAVLRLFTFSYLVLAFQRFTPVSIACQMIGLTMSSVMWTNFLLKICDWFLGSSTCGVKLLENRCVSLNRRKQKKAEPSWLIPRKLIENLELLFASVLLCYIVPLVRWRQCSYIHKHFETLELTKKHDKAHFTTND